MAAAVPRNADRVGAAEARAHFDNDVPYEDVHAPIMGTLGSSAHQTGVSVTLSPSRG
jgi:hypothetical protein